MKRFITIFSVIILIVALPIGVWVVQREQNIRSNAAPATTLYFNSSALSKQQGDTFSLDVTVDTGSNSITAADLVINTEPAKIKITGITQVTSFLSNVVVPAAYTDSKATLVLGSPGGSSAKDSGVLATVTFQVVAADGTASITFTGSSVTDFTEGGNVLLPTTPTTVTIASSGTSPTVIQTPTATPTGESTLTPTETPSGESTLTPTVTPTEGSAQTPTPTPTLAGGGGSGENSTTLSVTSPVNGGMVTTGMPTLTGTAPVGSTVSITIYSDPITVAATTGENGTWSYTLAQALPEGEHRVVITSVAADGTTQTQSSTFYVQTGSIPVTGPSVMTLIFPVVLAASFILLGLAL